MLDDLFVSYICIYCSKQNNQPSLKMMYTHDVHAASLLWDSGAIFDPTNNVQLCLKCLVCHECGQKKARGSATENTLFNFELLKGHFVPLVLLMQHFFPFSYSVFIHIKTHYTAGERTKVKSKCSANIPAYK